MKKFFLIFLFLVSFVAQANAQDLQLATHSRYLDLRRGGAWGTSDVNRVFIFSPLDADQSMCIFIANNNPTNSHTITLSVFQTGDTQVADYSNNTGRWIADTIQGTISPVAAGSMNSAFVHSNAAARVALAFSGSAAAGGSPDTADIFLVQTNATSCGPVQSGNSISSLNSKSFVPGGSLPGSGFAPADPNNNLLQFPSIMFVQTDSGGQPFPLHGSPATGIPAATTLESNSTRLGTAYATFQSFTNPAAGADLLNVIEPGSPARIAYFDSLILSATVSTQVALFTTSAGGASCTILTPGKLSENSVNGAIAVASSGCVTAPTSVFNMALIFIPANGTIVINLRGLKASVGGQGVMTTANVAVTGTVFATITWYEDSSVN